MANDISLDTLQNNKKKTQVIMYMMIGLIMIALGATFAGTGTTPALIGGVLAIFGGGYFGYTGYNMLVDPKNERVCTKDYFNVFTSMKIPDSYVKGDVAIDTVIDTDEQTLVVKAQYGGYGGVFLVSNTAATSIGGNYDAYFIPGNAKAILTKQVQSGTSGMTVADKLYLVKDVKSGNKVIPKDDSNKTEITTGISPVLSTICPN